MKSHCYISGNGDIYYRIVAKRATEVTLRTKQGDSSNKQVETTFLVKMWVFHRSDPWSRSTWRSKDCDVSSLFIFKRMRNNPHCFQRKRWVVRTTEGIFNFLLCRDTQLTLDLQCCARLEPKYWGTSSRLLKAALCCFYCVRVKLYNTFTGPR